MESLPDASRGPCHTGQPTSLLTATKDRSGQARTRSSSQHLEFVWQPYFTEATETSHPQPASKWQPREQIALEMMDPPARV